MNLSPFATTPKTKTYSRSENKKRQLFSCLPNNEDIYYERLRRNNMAPRPSRPKDAAAGSGTVS